MGSLFRGYCTEITNSFTKKILIEQGELDRLQQRQLRDYSPELQAMGRLLNDIRDIMESKKLSAEERMNMISGLQIRFDKLKKETGVLSGALPVQAVPAPPLPAPAVLPKILAEKGIRPDIVLGKDEEEQDAKDEYGENEQVDKDNSAQASDLSPQMARVIRWNVPGLYQQKAHRLLKRITENPDILTRNEDGEAVIYGDAIPGSNFKSLFKSMVSNQQNLNQVGIDEFLRALRSLGVKKDDISGEPLKIKYSNVAPYSTHKRHSTPTKYEDEDKDDEEEIRQPSLKHRIHKDKNIFLKFCTRRKGLFSQVTRAHA